MCTSSQDISVTVTALINDESALDYEDCIPGSSLVSYSRKR